MLFNKIIVALDLSEMDEKIILYSRFIIQNVGHPYVHFLHVALETSLPKKNTHSYEYMIEKDSLILKQKKEKLATSIKPIFDLLNGANLKTSTIIGNPQRQILKIVEDEKIDLLVVGKKQISGGSGIKARRIAQKANSAIWFITEQAKTAIQKILVPIDFSDNSLRALKAALHLKKQLKEVTITTLHVIDIPMTAYKINRNKDTIIAEMRSSATNKFLHFLSHNQIDRTGIKLRMIMNDEFDVARYIQKTAAQEKADLIIVGAKGRSLLDNFLFGSVTEKLVTYEYETPVLVIR